ncbi:MAG: SIR2 family protein, partial [Actinomycetota bacterium]|nr:SIR2 family protein [Actinomycetota bacterium]
MADGLVEDLRAQIDRGQAVVVAGAGVAAGASGGMAEASWHGLLESGVAWCQQRLPVLPAGWAEVVLGLVRLGDTSSLVSAAELVTEKLGGRQGGEYRRWLRETLAPLVTADPSVPEALGDLGVPIATTNYDGLIEAANDGLGTVTWRDGAGIQRILRGDGRAVVHLHGYWDDPESVVLGIRSYEAVLGDAAAQALQRAIASVSTLIFVGVGSGADDPNFGALRGVARKDLLG